MFGILGVGAAWLLARPEGPGPVAVVKVLADCLGAIAVGLALLRTDLFPVRSRPAVWRPLAVVGGLWTISEATLVVEAAAESFGGGLARLTVSSFGRFLQDISVGRLGIVTLLCTTAVCAYGLLAYRRAADWSTVPVLALAIVALVARPITGHMSQQTFGALFVAVHTVAAAVWLGTLAAMALTLRAKGAWAATLPVYSRLAWWSVWILAVSGAVNAAVKLGTLDALVDTGYGRIVVAKTVVLIVLVMLARRLRMTWLVSAAAHRTGADESIVRAGMHICIIALAFGLAAGLATTA